MPNIKKFIYEVRFEEIELPRLEDRRGGNYNIRREEIKKKSPFTVKVKEGICRDNKIIVKIT